MLSWGGIGKTLIIVGVVFIALGVLFSLLQRVNGPGSGLGWLGRLPGDILIKRENFSFYFPLTTSIILSVGVELLVLPSHKALIDMRPMLLICTLAITLLMPSIGQAAEFVRVLIWEDAQRLDASAEEGALIQFPNGAQHLYDGLIQIRLDNRALVLNGERLAVDRLMLRRTRRRLDRQEPRGIGTRKDTRLAEPRARGISLRHCAGW